MSITGIKSASISDNIGRVLFVVKTLTIISASTTFIIIPSHSQNVTNPGRCFVCSFNTFVSMTLLFLLIIIYLSLSTIKGTSIFSIFAPFL